MGLSDILRGMRNGPRGGRQRERSGGGGWGSRILMAVLGVLAYKAFSGRDRDPGGDERRRDDDNWRDRGGRDDDRYDSPDRYGGGRPDDRPEDREERPRRRWL